MLLLVHFAWLLRTSDKRNHKNKMERKRLALELAGGACSDDQSIVGISMDYDDFIKFKCWYLLYAHMHTAIF